MPDWGSAASGGLSGAKTGAMVAGPLGAVAGGIIGALPGLFGGGETPESAAKDAVLKNIPTQIQKGNSAIDSGLGSLGTAGHYYNTILGGNKEAIANLMNPQVGTVLSQYDNAAKEVARSAPRGGGATSTLAAIPFRKAVAAGSAYQSALSGAATGATNVGSAEGGIGSSLLSQTNSQSEPLLNWQKHIDDLKAKQGEGISKQVANLDFDAIKNGGKSIGSILARLLGRGASGSGGGSGVDPSLLGGE